MVTAIVAASAIGSASSTRMSTPEMPIATGTPIPSTAAWTDRRRRVRDHLVRRVDRGAGGPIRQGDVGDASRRDDRQEGQRAPARDGVDRDHGDSEDREHDRVGRDPEPEAVATKQGPRQQEQERDAHDVHHRRVAREESRQCRRIRVLRARAVEDQEVGQLAGECGQDLVGEQRSQEARPEQPPHRRPGRGVVLLCQRRSPAPGRSRVRGAATRSGGRSPTRARRTRPGRSRSRGAATPSGRARSPATRRASRRPRLRRGTPP